MSAVGQWICGVVEGFYGQPWSQAQRFELFDWMRNWRLNSYLYAPKDDLKHRAFWRESYGPEECDRLKELIQQCAAREVRFFYALAPGLDIRYAQPAERARIEERFDQMLTLGCRDFALLFDDIPGTLAPEDRALFGTFAAAHAQTTNAVFRWVRERAPGASFLFCPTPYCGRMAQRQLGGAGYLETIGRELLPEIQVLWTGPEIVSRTITPDDLPTDVLRRKPVLWDNLHANDYDRSRFYGGPYGGRDPEIRERIGGVLSNPNNEFPLNFVPLRTLAMFRDGDERWDERAAYLQALREWHPRFQTLGAEITFEHLRTFVDCFYLPHEEGPEANHLYEGARRLLLDAAAPEGPGFRERAARLREFCQRATELCDRNLFYALSQRVWDLREELDLIERGLGRPEARFTSDFHLPGTYRGGLVRRLQGLIQPTGDGAFVPNGSTL